jgi:hypothetical protein
MPDRATISFDSTHKTEILRVFWVDTCEIELEHPELVGMPEALEKIGSQLYGMTADEGSYKG